MDVSSYWVNFETGERIYKSKQDGDPYSIRYCEGDNCRSTSKPKKENRKKFRKCYYMNIQFVAVIFSCFRTL